MPRQPAPAQRSTQRRRGPIRSVQTAPRKPRPQRARRRTVRLLLRRTRPCLLPEGQSTDVHAAWVKRGPVMLFGIGRPVLRCITDPVALPCDSQTTMALVTAEDAARAPAAGIDADAAFADFDAMVEGWLDDEDRQPRRKSRGAAPRAADPMADAGAGSPRTVCARCHSLTHNGCVHSVRIRTSCNSPPSVVCACAGANAASDWHA